jgi:hypothetical protein
MPCQLDDSGGSQGEILMATRLTLDNPAVLFELVRDRAVIDLNTIDVAEVWALAGLAVLARLPDAPIKVNLGDNPMSRFAYALGFEEVVEGRTSTAAAEPGRTVKLTRFRGWDGYEALARRIVGLIVANEDVPEARNTLHYVLVELFRNVIQHSKDSLGGVVAAQVMNPGSTSRLVQVVVADAGLGIPEALRWEHPNLHGPEDALDKALWPHFSGTFPLGETGSAQGNAGMGLFVISEMAKLTGGRLLLASRGAALSLTSNPDDLDDNRIASVGAGVGFPGTLVAFEMALDNVHDFDGMLETIKERARLRTPSRATHKWLRFEAPPSGTQPLIVGIAVEHTPQAIEYAKNTLRPRILAGTPLVLDFRKIDFCTQSFLHALLYEIIRLAWATKNTIYIVNASPGVRSGLELLENYALGG